MRLADVLDDLFIEPADVLRGYRPAVLRVPLCHDAVHRRSRAAEPVRTAVVGGVEVPSTELWVLAARRAKWEGRK